MIYQYLHMFFRQCLVNKTYEDVSRKLFTPLVTLDRPNNQQLKKKERRKNISESDLVFLRLINFFLHLQGKHWCITC